MAALYALLSLFPLWLALHNELGPPLADDVAAKAAASRPPQGVTRTSKRLYHSFTFWQLAFHSLVIPFTGFGMKLLVASVFEAGYNVSFMDSANLASLSLVFIAIARLVVPLLVKPGNMGCILTAMILMNAALYSSYPTIIEHLPIGWFVLAKTLSGCCFAGMMSLMSLLILEAYTPRDLPALFSALGPARGIGFAFGPVTGHCTYLFGTENHWSQQYAYNPFFYACAALAFAAALNMLLLHARLSRRRAKETSSVECSLTKLESC